MKYINLKNLIAGLFSSIIVSSSHAVVFNMAPLEFSNRAGCAELSKKPARSVFLQIDAFNGGKVGLAQGLIAQQNQSTMSLREWSDQGAKNFRLWSTHLAYEVMNALLNGKLPLLNPEGTSPLSYSKAVETCLSKNQFLTCPAMNDFLSEVWSRSKMLNPNWQELGLNNKDFIQSTLNQNAAIGCHVIRKFSSFHSHLKNQKIGDKTLTEIGMDTFIPSDVMDSCFSTTATNDPRFSTVQLDIANLANESEWTANGFKFWHSFKLFYSWAWRHAPEYQQEFGVYKQAFSSIAFEESVMLVPNGCRSVELPKCDSTGLSSDVLRAAKYLGALHPAIGELPQKPIDSLLSGKATDVNNDIMGLLRTEDPAIWSKDFKARLTVIRSEMQMKLATGVSKLQLITSLMSTNEIDQDLKGIENDSDYDKIETYLACEEYRLAKANLDHDINSEIQNLNAAKDLQNAMMTESGKNLPKYAEYYKSLSNSMDLFCKSLESKHRDDSGTNDPDIVKSLNEWAFGLKRPIEKRYYDSKHSQCIENPYHSACPKNLDKRFLVAHSKSTDSADKEIVICKTSLECARTVLQSLVSVISVRRYAQAFLPLNDIIKSPNLLNNYAAPTACKLYDPFKHQRDSWKLFIADLGSAFVQGVSCGAVSTNVLNLSGDKVIAYNEIMNQEQIEYEAVTQKYSTKAVVGADLAFLSGISCGASVANAISNNPSGTAYSYFGLVQLVRCDGKSKNEYTVDKSIVLNPNGKLIGNTTIDNTTLCFKCNFGLSTIVKYACAAPYSGQIFAAGVGVFQGVLRLISNLTDSNNMIQVGSVNVDQISQSYRTTLLKTPNCHNDLRRGVTCKINNGGK